MPSVRVKTLGMLYDITGRLEHTVEVPDGSTVYDVINQLIKMFPRLEGEILDDNGEIKEFYRVLLNGREVIYLGGVRSPVGEGDVVAIIPPVGGGLGIL